MMAEEPSGFSTSMYQIDEKGESAIRANASSSSLLPDINQNRNPLVAVENEQMFQDLNAIDGS